MAKKSPVSPWHTPRMPADYLRVALEIAAERGIDREALLARGGLRKSVLSELEPRITHAAYGLVVAALVEATADEGMGFEIGLRLGPTAHGGVGYAVMCCATLRQAAEIALKFQATRVRGITVTMSEQEGNAILSFQEEWGSFPLKNVFFDGFMAAMYRCIQILLGNHTPFGEIRFSHPSARYVERFRPRLPVLRHGMSGMEIRFPAELLDRPLLMPNAAALRMALLQCEQEAALLGDEDQIVSMVQTELMLNQQGYPSLAIVADRLNMSTRTLRRRLEENHSSFKQLLDAARRRDALRLIENRSLQIQQIAGLLGYANPPSFTRAFKGWAGMSPADYRQKRHSE